MKCYVAIEEKTFNDGSTLVGVYTDKVGVPTYLEIDTHPRDGVVYKVYHCDIE